MKFYLKQKKIYDLEEKVSIANWKCEEKLIDLVLQSSNNCPDPHCDIQNSKLECVDWDDMIAT